MAKFAIMQMFHLVAIFATNAILKLKRQYPGSVVPLAMFSSLLIGEHQLKGKQSSQPAPLHPSVCVVASFAPGSSPLYRLTSPFTSLSSCQLTGFVLEYGKEGLICT